MFAVAQIHLPRKPIAPIAQFHLLHRLLVQQQQYAAPAPVFAPAPAPVYHGKNAI